MLKEIACEVFFKHSRPIFALDQVLLLLMDNDWSNNKPHIVSNSKIYKDLEAYKYLTLWCFS